MPTKSNNIGGRGGARPGAGRKKSAVKEKANNGNPGGRRLEILDIPDVEGVEMPKPHDFLSAEQRDGSELQASEIYEETWQWLKKIGCASKVSPQLLERYAMCSARWIQCEEMTNKLGFLSKHPTTQKPMRYEDENIWLTQKMMGLTTWAAAPEGKIVKSDVSVAKNYLSEQEMRSLERIVSAYLDLAEDRAERHIPMTMEDWAKRLDLFLMADDREVLQDAGKITAEISKAKAETEFEKYRVIQDRLFMSDFDKYMLELEENAKK